MMNEEAVVDKGVLSGQIEVFVNALFEKDLPFLVEAAYRVVNLVEYVFVDLGPPDQVAEVEECGDSSYHAIGHKPDDSWKEDLHESL